MSFASSESSRYSGKPVNLYLVQGAPPGEDDVALGPFAYCDGEADIVRDGITFHKWPIKRSKLSHDGTLDKSDVTVTLALGTELDDQFIAYPPSQVVNLTIFEGHVGQDVTLDNYPAVWLGRILSGGRKINELELSCQPVSTSIKRPGLRRNYQLGCPHVLYGDACKADKSAATVTRQFQDSTGSKLTLDSGLGADYGDYIGGLIQWTNVDSGAKELRTIAGVDDTGRILTIRGLLRGLDTDTDLAVSKGCNRQMSGCTKHNNILNYGGQPFIPLDNPLSQKNQFY
jgi:hypothetical protein